MPPKVYIPYCTSDAYIGDIGASDVPFGFNFRGRAVVTAVFSELARARGLATMADAHVMYGGCSAGARGSLFNNEFVRDWLSANTAVTRYGVALDSSFWIDLPPLAGSEPSFAQITQQVLAMVNATALLSPACIAGVGAGNAWRCMFGQYATPYVVAPYLLFAWSFDSYQVRHCGSACPPPPLQLATALDPIAQSHAQLSYDIGAAVPTTQQQLDYAQSFHDELLVVAVNDTVGPARTGTAALIPACYHHCITEASLFTQMAVNGTTMEQATVSWFFGDGSAPAYVIDRCAGFNCGSYCPPLP